MSENKSLGPTLSVTCNTGSALSALQMSVFLIANLVKFRFQPFSAFLKHMNKCCQEKEDVAPEDLGCVQCGDEFTNQPDLMEHMELCKEGPGKASFIVSSLPVPMLVLG